MTEISNFFSMTDFLHCLCFSKRRVDTLCHVLRRFITHFGRQAHRNGRMRHCHHPTSVDGCFTCFCISQSSQSWSTSISITTGGEINKSQSCFLVIYHTFHRSAAHDLPTPSFDTPPHSPSLTTSTIQHNPSNDILVTIHNNYAPKNVLRNILLRLQATRQYADLRPTFQTHPLTQHL